MRGFSNWIVVLCTTLFVLSSYADDRGKKVYEYCVPCHGAQGHGKQSITTPAIAGLPDWYTLTQLKKFKALVRGYHSEDFEGLRMHPIAKMIKDDDLPKVADYVSKMPEKYQPLSMGTDDKLPDMPTGSMMTGTGSRAPNAANGEKKYQAICASCHGPDGLGNKDLGSPPLVAASDWYLFKQLKKFKYGLRGADATKDPLGAGMAAMAKLIEDEDEMRDIVFYVKHLTPKKEMK